MNADDSNVVVPEGGTIHKHQTYSGPLVPPDAVVRETMKSNGAVELPLGGLACDCPLGEADPNCCINKLGLK